MSRKQQLQQKLQKNRKSSKNRSSKKKKKGKVLEHQNSKPNPKMITYIIKMRITRKNFMMKKKMRVMKKIKKMTRMMRMTMIPETMNLKRTRVKIKQQSSRKMNCQLTSESGTRGNTESIRRSITGSIMGNTTIVPAPTIVDTTTVDHTTTVGHTTTIASHTTASNTHDHTHIHTPIHTHTHTNGIVQHILVR